MPDTREKQVIISAQKARQGEIVLRKRWQRGVFIAGLVGAVLYFATDHVTRRSLISASASHFAAISLSSN